MTGLQRLIEAVEGGARAAVIDFYTPLDWADGSGDLGLVARSAFNGSLDAAKALHDALLPGWVARPQIGGAGAGVSVWHCTIEDWETGEEIHANNMPGPARAWLLAILKAYEAQQ